MIPDRPTAGQTEDERAFAEAFDRAVIMAPRSLYHMREQVRPVARRIWTEAIRRGQELRGCCEEATK